MPHRNTLLILCDQLRHDTLGYRGCDWVDTPHIDKLAAEGTVFTQCCTNSPVCAPARIGLASGLQPSRLGALDNNAFLPARVPTYYQRLRDHGVHVGGVGKFDLGKPHALNGIDGASPRAYQWGFTRPHEAEGKMHAGRSKPGYIQGPYARWLEDQGLLEAFNEDYTKRQKSQYREEAAWDSVLPTHAFEDTYIGQQAVRFLEDMEQDFPWHLFVSFVGPHNPFDPPTEYADRYRNAEVPEPIAPNGEGKPPHVVGKMKQGDPELIRNARRQYAAAIAAIDDQVGEIVQALKDRGEYENTTIIFSADHGEMLADHGLWTKGVFYEASLRVPLIVAGPDLPEGATCDAPVELSDVHPTVCEASGVEPLPNLDAISIMPLVTGEADELTLADGTPRDFSVSTLFTGGCLRNERWKFIRNHNEFPELYDLQNDPDEQHNLASEKPQMVRELNEKLSRRLLVGQGSRG